MDKNFILNSIGIGGIIFVGFILFWFVSRYLKKRLASDQTTKGLTPSSQIAWEEKRRHPRIAVSWQVSIETSERTDNVQLKDISLGGAFVVCPEPLGLSDKFEITIQIPNREPLRLNAEVVWSNKNMPAERVVNRGMGIKFINNSQKDRQHLFDALAASMEENQRPR